MNKEKNSQEEMKTVIMAKMLECLNTISEEQEKNGIPKDGFTVLVGEIGVDGKSWDLCLCLTEKGILDNFKRVSDIFYHVKN